MTAPLRKPLTPEPAPVEAPRPRPTARRQVGDRAAAARAARAVLGHDLPAAPAQPATRRRGAATATAAPVRRPASDAPVPRARTTDQTSAPSRRDGASTGERLASQGRAAEPAVAPGRAGRGRRIAARGRAADPTVAAPGRAGAGAAERVSRGRASAPAGAPQRRAGRDGRGTARGRAGGSATAAPGRTGAEAGERVAARGSVVAPPRRGPVGVDGRGLAADSAVAAPGRAGARVPRARVGAPERVAARRGVAAGMARVGRLPVVRLLPASTTSAPRAPFVLLVLALLGGGLVLLLLLNAASAADSFRQRELQRQISAMNLQEQELQRKVATMRAPGALADAARKLGMVPSGEPGFLVLMPDGTFRIVGDPVPATAAPTPAGSTPASRPGGGR